MLVCAFFAQFAHETAGAARTRHSLLPLLRESLRKTRALSAAARGKARETVSAVPGTRGPRGRIRLSFNQRSHANVAFSNRHIRVKGPPRQAPPDDVEFARPEDVLKQYMGNAPLRRC